MTFLLLFLLGGMPSASRTAWMEPDAFHLRVGMSQKEALRTLKEFGHKPVRGKARGDWVVDYSETQRITLAFTGDRLTSVRFELSGFVHDVREAFRERSAALRKKHGTPEIRGTGSTLLYERANPNIMAVMWIDSKTEAGKSGLGFVIVRYFEPPVAE